MRTIDILRAPPAARRRGQSRVRERFNACPVSCRRWRVALWALLLLPCPALAEAVASGERLQREWIEIQVSKGRQPKQDWWQKLDPDRLQTYIAAGAEPNVSDPRGWTPLHSAARYNADPEVLRALLDAGAIVGAKDRAGDTPLHWAAAENSNVEIITLLLSAGADVNARDRFGWQPLHSAADRNSNPAIIDALLDAGAEPRKRAYFFLFRPAFLVKHNSNLSDADRHIALTLLEGVE